ncbi:hypothetical protein AB1E18_001807 [Capra hircus]
MTARLLELPARGADRERAGASAASKGRGVRDNSWPQTARLRISHCITYTESYLSLYRQAHRAPSLSFVPAPAPPLVGSEGRDPTAPSWTERGGGGPWERYRLCPHLPEPDGSSPCASTLSGLGSSRTVGRSGTDRLPNRPWFREEPLPEAVHPQPTVREL